MGNSHVDGSVPCRPELLAMKYVSAVKLVAKHDGIVHERSRSLSFRACKLESEQKYSGMVPVMPFPLNHLPWRTEITKRKRVPARARQIIAVGICGDLRFTYSSLTSGSVHADQLAGSVPLMELRFTQLCARV